MPNRKHIVAGLIALLLAAAGLGGWLYFNRKPPLPSAARTDMLQRMAVPSQTGDLPAQLPQALPPLEAAKPAPPPEPAKPPEPPAPPPPRFDVVRVTPQGEAVIAGRAEPGSTVTVMDGGRALGSTQADSRGEWVFLPTEPLPAGTRELSLRENPAGGGAPRLSDRVVVLVTPEPGKDLAGRPAEEPTTPLALSAPRDGVGGSQVLQAPAAPAAPAEPPAPQPPDATSAPVAAAPSSPVAAAPPAPAETAPPPPPGGVSVETLDYDDKGQVAVGGRSKPGGAVQLYLDNVLVGRAHTDPEGRWRLSPDRPVDPGIYQLRADQVNEAGKVTARAELPVQVSKTPPDFPRDANIIVQPGNSLWRLARRTYGDGFLYTEIYQANREQIRDPDLIYPGQIFALPSKSKE